MGSSAEAIVAGIAAAAAFAQTGDLNRPAVFDMAAQIEGHPDNVAPAVFGGLTVSWDFETAEGVGSVAVPGGEPLHGGFHAVNYPVDPSITVAVFVPDYELSTEKARQALPRELPYKDAVYNVSRVGLLPAAMNPVVLAQAAQQGKSGVAAAPAQDADTCACSGGTRESAFADELAAAQAQSNALLFTATQDKLHQPYRGALMPPSTELIALFRSKGYAAKPSTRSHRSSLLPAIGVCFTCPSTPPASKSSVAKSRRRLPLAGAGRRRRSEGGPPYRQRPPSVSLRSTAPASGSIRT